MELAISFLAVIGACLIGSLSFAAVIVSRAFGLSDPRSYGSKTRCDQCAALGQQGGGGGHAAAGCAQGWLPVWAANHWAGVASFGDGTLALVGLAAFIGHLFPVFFKFKGGKGGHGGGCAVGVDWLLGLLTLLAWVAVVAVSRYSSLGALAAAVFAPVCYLMGSGRAGSARRRSAWPWW